MRYRIDDGHRRAEKIFELSRIGKITVCSRYAELVVNVGDIAPRFYLLKLYSGLKIVLYHAVQRLLGKRAYSLSSMYCVRSGGSGERRVKISVDKFQLLSKKVLTKQMIYVIIYLQSRIIILWRAMRFTPSVKLC